MQQRTNPNEQTNNPQLLERPARQLKSNWCVLDLKRSERTSKQYSSSIQVIRGVPKLSISINSSTSWRVERRGTDAKLFPSISWSTSKEGKSSCWTRVRTSVEYWKCACSPGKVIIGAKFHFLGWKSAQQTELKSSRKVGQFCWDLNCRQSLPQMEQINPAGPEMAKTVLLKTTFCVDNTSRSCWLYWYQWFSGPL